MQLKTDITKTTIYPDTLTSLVVNSKNQNVDQLLENMFNFFYEVMDYDSNSFWISNLSNEDCVVTLTKNGSPKDIYLECMIGLERIVLDTISDLSFTIPANSKVYIRSDNSTFSSSSSDYYTFSFDKQCNIGGNIMSLVGERELTDYVFYRLFYNNTNLVDASQLLLPATNLAEYCYYQMFQDCTSLTTAPELPATTLDNYCYEYMFYGCTSLTNAPELPATVLANYCYYEMFYGCTSLTTAPALPATELASYCYNGMFKGCTSLTEAPELPATTLVWGCYSFMFAGCSSLTTAPALPASELADYCYRSMFRGCTSLTTAPELPATELARWCYDGMFSGCTSLTEAPVLPATTLTTNCYYQMFYGCTNLNYIKALFTTTPGSDYTNNWVLGVSSSGIFIKNSDVNWNVTGPSGIPSGWTVQTASA